VSYACRSSVRCGCGRGFDSRRLHFPLNHAVPDNSVGNDCRSFILNRLEQRIGELFGVPNRCRCRRSSGSTRGLYPVPIVIPFTAPVMSCSQPGARRTVVPSVPTALSSRSRHAGELPLISTTDLGAIAACAEPAAASFSPPPATSAAATATSNERQPAQTPASAQRRHAFDTPAVISTAPLLLFGRDRLTTRIRSGPRVLGLRRR
jgi:hypothetical protein